MPETRSLLVAVGLGLGAGVYLDLAVGWPTFLAIAVGAVMALVALLIAASLDDRPEDADRAWREAAPDLVSRIDGPESHGDSASVAPGMRTSQARRRRGSGSTERP